MRRDSPPLPAPVFLKGTPRVLVVGAVFYHELALRLMARARVVLENAGAVVDEKTVFGALEIPCLLAAFKPFEWQGVVALGCVCRGETGHYDIVANTSAHGLMQWSVQQGIPAVNGILTVNTLDQAEQRADVRHGDSAGYAARALIQMLHEINA
jgi:6,7-dimethyl-8-ribityllumazine synthase